MVEVVFNKIKKLSESSTSNSSSMEPNQQPVSHRRFKVLWLVIIVLAVWFLFSYFNVIPAGIIPRFWGGYQAVFLTNGQVYFGKLYRENSQYPTLRDIYYLQVTQPPQPLREGEVPPSNINLVKLGGELHGPKDAMRINRDQILFVEDLKSDSRVVQAIEQLKARPPAAPAQ